MNILITGFHGFVGGNIVASLQNQHIIFGLDIVSQQQLKDVSQLDGWSRDGSKDYITRVC